MKIVTPAQMNAIDSCSINEYGIPSLLLMENAAAAVANEAASMMGGASGKTVTVIAGRGNNGGDAFAAARLLYSKGAYVRVYLVGPKDGISGDALINMGILERIGIRVEELAETGGQGEKGGLERLSADIKNSCMIIDGIFGTGLSRDVDGIAGMAVEMMNASGKPILSIDIPSGINGADGSIMGVCVKADVTVTFCMPKLGLVLHPGCEYVGRLRIADIGIPPEAIARQRILTELTGRAEVSRLIPARKAESNKGDYGRVLIITGSTGMTGSGCLASLAALRTGAGLVYAGVPESLAGIYGSMLAEHVVLPLKDGGAGILSEECAEQIITYMEKMDVAAVGPGLTASDTIRRIVEKIVANSKVPLVLDADALNAISGNTEILGKLKTDAVITPHPGEMARLTGLDTAGVQRDRIGVAARFAARYGVTVVLKGNRTVIAQPDGRIHVNPTGNAGMATAGSGDVLTGVIAGMAAQGVPVADAAIAGVYLHGLAGDKAAGETGMHGMLAGDIVRHLPLAIMELAAENAQ
ncbi:MAG: NAD(P)H-hydrate dehydratase [Bacillota bacterium]